MRVAGAQEAERTRQYVSIPSTAGTQAAERSRLFRDPKPPCRRAASSLLPCPCVRRSPWR
ncbi:MAG: hypothetical protein EPN40_06525 [Rhodanobacteraceae bacterium]|nr:MAG: hypothetical protein EPN40_06525 [Rhodanobacteraceae bacterium]